MKEEMIIKALLKILKQQRDIQDNLDYLSDAVNLLFDMQKPKISDAQAEYEAIRQDPKLMEPDFSRINKIKEAEKEHNRRLIKRELSKKYNK